MIPYSLEALAVTSDDKTRLLGKYGPIYFSPSSNEYTITIPISLKEEIPPEKVSGAFVARIYIEVKG